MRELLHLLVSYGKCANEAAFKTCDVVELKNSHLLLRGSRSALLVTSINMLYRNSLSARLTVIVCLAVPLGF